MTLGIGLYFLFQDGKFDNLTSEEKEFISFFNEIALKSEYGESSNRINKWNIPMILYVQTDTIYEKQTQWIRETANKINASTDGAFELQITDDISLANSVIYLCSLQNLPFYNESFASEIDKTSAGYFHFYWSNFEINRAEIFINTTIPLKIQKSTIFEELTQTIGLANDSEKYEDSVFYKWKVPDSIFTYAYNKMDIKIIKTLYNPKIKVGMNIREAENVLIDIIKIERKKNVLQQNL